ncbi:interleukin-31 receptor subunit alpha [Pseudorasbora parva]|uniref:interleukin-31 receptor subunit alpha n=1 Tax=Pseudorasbora parva TaxID=51549 RepID=UPI00351DAEAB
MRKCSAAFYFTLGFISLCTTEATTGSCNCNNLNVLKDKCNSTEGVYDLTCFIRYKKSSKGYICEWKNGDSSTSYTLYAQQRKCTCVPVHNTETAWTSSDFSVIGLNMTAHVIATSEDQGRCTYKNFSGNSSELTQCGPPSEQDLTFKRSSGRLSVEVDWREEILKTKHIKTFTVKYRAFNTKMWKEQESKNNSYALWNVTSSLSYELQIHCVHNANCMQCPLSEIIIVPQELTDAPSIQWEAKNHIHNRIISAGQRKVVVMWKNAKSEAVADYNVTVRKVSGDRGTQDSFKTKAQSLTLILSYSAYNISVRALNSVGSSPVSSIDIEQMDEWRDLFGLFSVNITRNNSFSLSWNSSVSSVCYAVEWWAKGQIPAFQSFYAKQAHREITETKRIFQPYTRYYFFLHNRTYMDTCNLKNVNNSEMTYGAAQAYFIEGSPISAPRIVSILNITQHSSVITWSPVSEEDLRGFLLGYNIYYTKDNNETSLKVDPSINSFELLNLESNSAYHVQLSAFTAAGEGQRSDFKHFVTNPPEFTTLSSIIAAVVVGIIFILLAVHVSCRILHRAKKLMWPSIPNPENSNAVQKIEIALELGILEPLNIQRLEESEGCDSSTVYVIERKREATPLSSPPISQAGVKPTILLFSEDEDSPFILEEITPPDTPTQISNRESVSTETFPVDLCNTDFPSSTSVVNDITNLESKDSGETISNMTRSDFIPASQPAVVFMSDYTTMEIFQQATMSGIQGSSIQTAKAVFVPGNPGQDYIRQSYFASNGQPNNPSGACNGAEVLSAEIAVL